MCCFLIVNIEDNKPSLGQPMDSADFEQLLWQPAGDDGGDGIEDHDDSIVKMENELDMSLVKGIIAFCNGVSWTKTRHSDCFQHLDLSWK